jgi:hypothetical protein
LVSSVKRRGGSDKQLRETKETECIPEHECLSDGEYP